MNDEMKNNLAINHLVRKDKQTELVAILALLYSQGWQMVKGDRRLERPADVLIEYIDSLEY